MPILKLIRKIVLGALEDIPHKRSPPENMKKINLPEYTVHQSPHDLMGFIPNYPVLIYD